MQPTTNAVPLKQASSLQQPLFGCLVRELRSLTKLTQGQFAAAIGVNYVTASRWETGRIQPSALALRQVQSFIEKLSQSAAQPIQDRDKELLEEYFAETQG